VLVRVNTKHFCAGMEIDDNGMITSSAPILKGWIGKRNSLCRKHYEAKGILKSYLFNTSEGVWRDIKGNIVEG
jgi:hypothetical protein